jgi:5-(carboxyamino)imidazole ribonucleotide mutase
VIIAGAGGAAHLPGMVASITLLPVIGVPIKTSSLDGLDSLLSIAQMPAGVPVATVAINGAKNAAILACEMLALENKEIATKVESFKKNLERDVLQRARKVELNSLQNSNPN